MLNFLIPVLLFLTSVFLILLVLIQRGRGGGLAGAFGGLGGQSAFGTKAGDLFTRITIGVAAFWIILCAASVKIMNNSGSEILSRELGGAATTAPASAPAGDAKPGAAPTDGKTEAAPADASKAAPAETAPAEAAPAGTTPASAPAAESTPAATAPAAEAAPASAETPEKK
jgi:preprotein translocase subunit SecG